MLEYGRQTSLSKMTHETLDQPSTQSTRLDTHSLRLDHILGVAAGSEAYFQANPTAKNFIYFGSQPAGEGSKEEQYRYTVSRDTVQQLKTMALGVFETLSQEGQLGREVARDVVQSWRNTDAHVVFVAEEARR